MTVFFQDGTQVACITFVGLDGVMSRIARQLLDPKKFDDLNNVLDVRSSGVLRLATKKKNGTRFPRSPHTLRWVYQGV